MKARTLAVEIRRRASALALTALLGACASVPPPPAWQTNARSAIDASVTAYRSGDSRGEAPEFARARDQVARTGRPELVARVELMRCAARVASLVFEACEGFERLRADAAAAEQAYAGHLAAVRLPSTDIERLPVAQRGAAAAVASGAALPAASAQAIADPLSRLIAIAVAFQAGLASPQLIALAADTAAAQGWRRPLLAWLEVQASLAERSGDLAEAERLRRRIALARNARP